MVYSVESIPLSIEQLTNLIYLNLGDNQLTDSIPEAIGNLIKNFWK